MPQSPHDALLKRAFSEKENAAGELRAVLPAALVAALDLDTLRVCPGSYVDEALRDLHSDLLYSVRLGGRDARIYVLFEHQSTVDRFMAFRMLRYIVRIWDEWRREHPHARALPAVIPVVLHHGAAAWTGPTTLQALIDLEPELLDAVRPFVPELRMLLDDLGVQTEEALYERAMSAFGRLALMALRSAGLGSVDDVHLWVAAFHELARAVGSTEALEPLFRYLLQVLGSQGRVVIESLRRDADRATKEGYVSLYDEILEEGERKGLYEGRRALLLKQFTLKFGPPSEETRRRVEAATEGDLEAWAERILVATRLEDVWG